MRELSLENCRLDKRYDLHQRLSRGSYAEIFVAEDRIARQLAHKQVVIKALNVFLQDDLDTELERTLVENFQNEAIAIDRVRHPNIISRLGHGTARDLKGTMFHYIVLEYLEGGDLQQATRAGWLKPDIAMKYVEQICAGLRHAHRNGVIHRDIKPQNVLLTKDRETAKIADFGVARIHLSDAPITRVGTNIYAPPEHSPLYASSGNALASELTPAADIYSLAKTIYTLLTSESPRAYANNTITDLPITVRDENWADELLRVIRKATDDNILKRHQTVDELWEDLESVRNMVQSGETITRVRSKFTALPQPHVSKGYSPLAPTKPRFDTSRDLRAKHPLIAVKKEIERPVEVIYEPPTLSDLAMPSPHQSPSEIFPQEQPIFEHSEVPEAIEPIRKRRKFLRTAAAALMLLAVFVGLLYGTHSILTRSGIFSDTIRSFTAQTGKANTDINLRPDPSVRNEPYGVVTKDSRVRIISEQDNWYQIDVIEQGRVIDAVPTSERGWVSGRFIDIDQN